MAIASPRSSRSQDRRHDGGRLQRAQLGGGVLGNNAAVSDAPVEPTPRSDFQLRSLAGSVYLPTFLFALGIGAVVPLTFSEAGKWEPSMNVDTRKITDVELDTIRH